jgi:hypothetical protein
MCGTVTPLSADCENSVFWVVFINRVRGGEYKHGCTNAKLGILQHFGPHAMSRVVACTLYRHLKQNKGLDTLNQTRSEK